MTEYIIGIDIGTGSTKAVALDYAGNILDTAQFHYPTLQPDQDSFEQAPELIWQAFIKSVSKITSKHNAPSAIVLSSAMHSIIAADKEGNALHNMITWADNRSANIATKLYHSSIAEMLYEQTGTPIHAMSPLCKLIWMRHHLSGIFHQTFKFISMKEYIWFKLFGVFEIDHSIASATGLFDIQRLTWNNNALDLATLTQEKLSELVSTFHSRICHDQSLLNILGISAKTHFVIGASDGCLANVGSFATKAGVAALTIGTSSAIRVTTPVPVYNFKAMTFNYILDSGTFITGGPSNNGGIVLQWFAENFLGKKIGTEEEYTNFLNILQKKPQHNKDLIFLPYLLGERAPIWNSDASGVFYGLKSYHTPSDLLHAVLEGISFALYDIAEHAAMNSSIHEINVSGGFVRSNHWLQLLSDIFGKKLCVINTSDASSIGACLLGLKSLGVITAYEQLKPVAAQEIFPDESNHQHYKKKFMQYRKLYQALLPLMQEKSLNSSIN